MPITGAEALVAARGLAAATKGTEEVTKIAAKVSDALRGSFKILNQEITIFCPEGTEKVSLAFEAESGVLGRKVRFPFGKPRYFQLRPLNSMADIGSRVAVTNDGFEIQTKGMAPHDLFLLEAEYEIETEGFVDALVERNAAKEVPKDQVNEYWMHAELKHPKVLSTRYGRLDLRDVDFGVDVGVSEDIKMVVPPAFRREIDAGAKLLAERDPRRKTPLAYAHAAAMRARGQGRNTNETLGDLQELFFPDTFKRYVEVTKDFHYSSCSRGLNYYDNLPFPTWPKDMTVVSRTDLSLAKCASEGVLLYKKTEFLDKVRKILGM